MFVYTVSGEHPEIDIFPFSLHVSKKSADKAAAALVNIIYDDTEAYERQGILKATPETWKKVLSQLAVIYGGGDHCWVEVKRERVEP